MKNYLKILSITVIFAGFLGYVQPAKAYFSLEIPKQLTELWQKVYAQEASILSPTKPPMPLEQQPMFQNPPPMPYQQPPNNLQPNQNCKIDGVEKSGGCEPYNNQNNVGNKPPNNENNEKQNGGDQTRMIKDIQRNAKQMESSINRFEKQMQQAEKSGGIISQEMKEKATKAKELLSKIKNATTAEDIENDTMNELQEAVNDLDQNGREVFEKIQRLNNIKKEIKNMERNVSNFDKQVAKLTKQKIAIPQDTADNIAKLKNIIIAVKNAKTWDDAESSGLEDMGDLMQNLGESQQNLEMLARWPQTLKQMDKEIKNLDRQVTKSKSAVERLKSKGIDLAENFTSFSADVNQLKSVRNEANNKIQSGDSQSAFDLVENEFFYKMDDVYENQRIIDTVTNLGKFSSEFKNGLNSLKREIANLKKKGEDTSELQSLYDEVKQKGDEILVLMRAKPIDTETIISALEDLESIRQQGSDKIQELGGGDSMPWEKGPQQFQQLKMSPAMNQYIPQKQSNNQTNDVNP